MQCRMPKQGYTKGLSSSMLLKAQVRAVVDSNPPAMTSNVSLCCVKPLATQRQTMTPTGSQYLLSKFAGCPQRIANPNFTAICGGTLNNTQVINPYLDAPGGGYTNGENAAANLTANVVTPNAVELTPNVGDICKEFFLPDPSFGTVEVFTNLPTPRASQPVMVRTVPFSTGISVAARTARIPSGSEATASRRQAARSLVTLQPWQQPPVQYPVVQNQAFAASVPVGYALMNRMQAHRQLQPREQGQGQGQAPTQVQCNLQQGIPAGAGVARLFPCRPGSRVVA